MLTFIVPVKSKRVSSDWLEFCNLVERTFKSICNQTDQNFKLVAVCHEIPQINFTHKNINYLQVDFDAPVRRQNESSESINKRREIDKGKKLKLGADYARNELVSDYIMTVDSDDYVSCRIAEFVNKSSGDEPGWYIKNGYLHFEGKSFLFATFKFSYLCGSSIIVKPELLQYFFEVDPILFFDHRLTVLNNTIKLKPLPFYGGIYSMANGENHLMHVSNIKKFNNHKGWLSSDGLKRIVAKLRNYSFRFITKKIRREFSFYG
ncbi:hypothetical protein ACPX19_09505 [Winogradskyella sp. HB-48]|uniref:hypothetical protein n=1 Tax=Winogradskyella sp. HB-48 TaxID=3416808 RepID=UPI003CF1B18B